VVDAREERAREVASRLGCKPYTRIEDLLARRDVEAVSIATPDPLHREHAVLAAEAGKHILLEKPLAPTVAEGRAIVDAARKAGVLLMVDYILRFDPRYLAVKAAVDRGELGRLEVLWARRSIRRRFAANYVPWTHPLLGTATHDVDMMLWLTGSRVVRVYGESISRVWERYGAEDSVLALLRFEDGAIASYETTWILPDGALSGVESRLHIIGDKGAAYIELPYQGVLLYGETGTESPDTHYWPLLQGEVMGDLREALAHFIECVAKGQEPRVTGEDGLRSLEVVEAIRQSTRENRPIEVSTP
jgi:predicted dehydrogenase